MADPTFDAVYVGANYDSSVTVPSGLSASHLIAFVAAFGSSADSITMSGWTQLDIAGASSGGATVRQAVFYRTYAAGTYSPTLGGGLGSYELTIYAVNDVGSIGAVVSEAANGENPATWSLGPTVAANGAFVIGCVTCWGDCPKPADLSGTWTTVLGPPTLPDPNFSEQRTWYASRNAGTATFAITKTSTNPDTGVATVIVLESAGSGSFAELAGDAPVTVTAAGDLSRATDLAGGTTATLTPAGSLSLTVNLGGNATATLSATGDLSTATEFAGNIDLSLTPSGALSLTADLAGASTWGFSGTGNLALTASLGGNADLSLAPVGALSTASIKFTLMYNSLGVGTWTGGTSAYAIAQSLGLAAYFPDATFVLVGSNGATTGGLIGSYTADVLPEYDPSARNIIVFWEGVNSLLIPTTPAAELAQLEAFAATAQGDGFEIITATLLPIGYPGEDVAASDYNTLLRSSSAFDCMIDLRARLPQFSPVAGNPLYDDDEDAHLSDGPTGGYAVSTAEWAEGINEYLTGATVSGAVSFGFTATGDLVRATDLAGATSATFSVSGALSLSIDLASDSAITLTPAGNLSTATDSEFEGAAAIVVSASGALALTVDLAAAAPVSVSATGDAGLLVSLDGAASVGLVGSGEIDRALDLGGTSGISLTASGDLATGLFADLAAAASVGFEASGALALLADLQSQGAISVGASGGLALTVDMAGNSTVSMLAAGNLVFVAPTESIGRLSDNWTHTTGVSLTSPTWSQLQ